MSGKTRTIPAGLFKAKCLQIMDEVNNQHCVITITKHGVPVARLVPVEDKPSYKAYACMKDSVIITGDIIKPIDEQWDADIDE